MTIEDVNDMREEEWKSMLIDLLKSRFPDGHSDSKEKLNEVTIEQAQWLEDEYGYTINMDYAVKVIECEISFPLEIGEPITRPFSQD